MTTNTKVYLVGAGPGDPDLLTVKALRLIQTADVLVYDRLVSAEILQLIPDTVTRIYAGKATRRHSLSQDKINQLLLELAQNNRCVVRLKGGDPFIFGRGAEEALVLSRHQIPFEIVSGITAAQACAAYAGIPLTCRGLAQGVQFVTGHYKNNETLNINPAVLSDPDQTLVVYMGLGNLSLIVRDLLAAGRSRDTQAAIIEQGTTPRQRRVVTSIGKLQQAARQHAIASPALLVIGSVVSLAEQLDWFSPWLEEAERLYA